MTYPGRRPSREDHWPLGPMTPDDFPPGEYLAAYRTWKRDTWYRQVKIRLEFEIIEPAAFAKVLVPLFATVKQGHRRCSMEAKYYHLWVQANGGPPKRGQRMTPNVFRGYWRIRVRWGQRKTTGEPTTPCVDALLERVAGGAPC